MARTIAQIKAEIEAIDVDFYATQEGKFKALERGDEAGFDRRCAKLSRLQEERFNLSRLLPSETVEDI
jgi:hypothetical protein